LPNCKLLNVFNQLNTNCSTCAALFALIARALETHCERACRSLCNAFGVSVNDTALAALKQLLTLGDKQNTQRSVTAANTVAIHLVHTFELSMFDIAPLFIAHGYGKVVLPILTEYLQKVAAGNIVIKESTFYNCFLVHKAKKSKQANTETEMERYVLTSDQRERLSMLAFQLHLQLVTSTVDYEHNVNVFNFWFVREPHLTSPNHTIAAIFYHKIIGTRQTCV
jgi:hypothetical protein